MTEIWEPRNLLGNESSPYLLQHADNPVHWRPWGSRVLAEALSADKPILLSIGYAACHWCHVMAHESFENSKIAELMNQLFVNVKVDREERPDIDQIYMAALHALGEQGGWPLTMFLDPQGRPFWGGTYFPPERRYGRAGFPEILLALSKAWHSDRPTMLQNCKTLHGHLLDRAAPGKGGLLPRPEDAGDFAARLLTMHDPVHGGTKGAPKFPNAPITEAWYRAARGKSDSRFGNAFIKTVTQMSCGGIYDHLGGGLSRYSVDDIWLAPHFEKMLYDNAHYLTALTWAHQLQPSMLFRQRINQTIKWAVREMAMPGGAFASSLDADSEGEEGKFYVWSEPEIDRLLGKNSALFKTAYGVSTNGNFEGRNILNRLDNAAEPPAAAARQLARSCALLLSARENRIRPQRDDKILVDWNGYFIRAVAQAAFVFNQPKWQSLAARGYRFVVDKLSENRHLAHSWRNRVFVRPAMATDYSAMTNAALTLYETTGQENYLTDAEQWLSILEAEYQDIDGSYFLTSINSPALITRPRCDSDEANPSGASQILEALVRTATLSGKPAYLEAAWKLTEALHSKIGNASFGVAGYYNGLDSLQRQRHVLIQAPDRKSAEPFLDCIRETCDPALTFNVTIGQKAAMFFGAQINPPTAAALAIVCTQQACSRPLHRPSELAAELAGLH